MPYKLRKAPGKDLYWVVNKETKQKLSKIPMAKDQAMAQMRAVYANEHKSGGALSPFMSATNTLYHNAEEFRNSIEGDNTKQLATEATRERNKGVMASALAEQTKTVPELNMMSHKLMGKGMWDAVAPSGDYEFSNHLSGAGLLDLTDDALRDIERAVGEVIDLPNQNARPLALQHLYVVVRHTYPHLTVADFNHIVNEMILGREKGVKAMTAFKNKAETEKDINGKGMFGGKRSHKAQYVRWLAGKAKAKHSGYKHPYTPFIPKRVSVPKRSAFIHRMIASKEVIPKRDAKKGVTATVVEKKKRGRKAKVVEAPAESESDEEEEAPAPVASKDKKVRARELKAECLSTRKIADKLKEEGFSKVSPSTVVNLLKGSGYDEHPEDFFF